MTIDLASMPHLMDLLTNMYSDNEMACLREYSTNADDSHKDAGQTRPIEVTTPTSLFPYLKVKDFGVGMSEVDIEELYSQYGKSTKRSQTDTNGSMGIGGKSALAYTNSFSLTGIKDGVKIHVSISRTATGAGVMEVVDESLTDEPNGVEILIPAKVGNGFEHKAERLFRFWPVGSVLLNSHEPKREFTKVSDRTFTIPRESNAGDGYYASVTDYIVMGNVPYPVRNGLASDGLHCNDRERDSIVAYVTMNSPDEVVFTPSRENLNYTPQTLNAITGLREEYKAAVLETIKNAFDNVKTFSEAFVLFRELSRTYERSLFNGLKFQGKSMPTGYIYAPGVTAASGFHAALRATRWAPNRTRHSVDTQHSLTYEKVMEALVIINYPSTGSGVSATHKAKIREYRHTISHNSDVILFSEDTVPGVPWTDEATIVDWSTIKAIKLTPQTNSYWSGTVYDGGYNLVNPLNGGYDISHDLKPTDEIAFYSESEKSRESLSGTQRILISRYLPTFKMVEASTNRHGKLQRLFPKAIPVSAAMEKVGEAIANSLTNNDREHLIFDKVCGVDYLDNIAYNDLKDPFLSRAAKSRDITRSVALDDLRSVRGTAAIRKVEESIEKAEVSDISRRYPLLAYRHAADNLIYINAKFATLTPTPKGK